jgi:hypothetical protein
MDVYHPALNDLVEHGEENPSSAELHNAVETEESRAGCPTTSKNNRYLPTSKQMEKHREFYQPDSLSIFYKDSSFKQ